MLSAWGVEGDTRFSALGLSRMLLLFYDLVCGY